VTGDRRDSFPAQLSRYLPSVVVIAIDVKNLISLDTQNTIHKSTSDSRFIEDKIKLIP
jgi:hypothetical protein